MECELKDITVHYESFGDGKPMILLHGWGTDHGPMAGEMEPIFRQRSGWRRIYLDLPGHGRMPGKEWITNQDQMLDIVLDFIDHIIPGKRFTVTGASAGGYLARGIVYHKAASMDGLLLTVPVIRADQAKRHVPPHFVLAADPLESALEPGVSDVVQLAAVQSRTVVETLRANFASAVQSGDRAFQAKIKSPENYVFSFDVDALAQPFLAQRSCSQQTRFSRWLARCLGNFGELSAGHIYHSGSCGASLVS